VFGRKKTATAVSYCKQGKGLLKINGMPLALLQPQILREKVRVYWCLFVSCAYDCQHGGVSGETFTYPQFFVGLGI